MSYAGAHARVCVMRLHACRCLVRLNALTCSWLGAGCLFLSDYNRSGVILAWCLLLLLLLQGANLAGRCFVGCDWLDRLGCE